jgi:hypothetical protein
VVDRVTEEGGRVGIVEGSERSPPLPLTAHRARGIVTADRSLLAHAQKHTAKMVVRRCLAIATVAAAPFVGDGKLNSGVFGCGSLLDWNADDRDGDGSIIEMHGPSNLLSLAHTLQECSHPPIMLLPESMISSDFMQRSVVDWSVKSAKMDAPWVRI